jgi:hypothetical protein
MSDAIIDVESEGEVDTGGLAEPSYGSLAAAKRYPRSIKHFLVQAEALATATQEIAAACMYSLPRAGKQLTGPSVRLAEICASAWGNMRIGARIVREDQHFVTAQGYAHDLQTNTECTFEVRRRITTRDGKRFSDDMITVTVNAAQSIALRNAVFRVVPKALVDEIFNRARAVAVGDQKTLGDRRRALVAHFGKLGVTNDDLMGLVGKPSVEDIDGEDLLLLRGVANAIKDGTVNIDQAFREPRERAKAVGAQKRVAGIKAGDEPKPADATPIALHAKALEDADTPQELDAAYQTAFADPRLSKSDKARIGSLRDERRKAMEGADPGQCDGTHPAPACGDPDCHVVAGGQ